MKPDSNTTDSQPDNLAEVPAICPWWSDWLYRFLLVQLVLAPCVVLIVCYFLVHEGLWLIALPVAVFGLLVGMMPFIWQNRQANRRIRSILAEAGSYSTLADLLSSNPLHMTGVSRMGFLAILLKYLPGDAGAGETIYTRIRPDSLNAYTPDARPLQQPFEPVDTRELGARLNHLFDAESPASQETHSNSTTRKTSKSNKILVGFWFRRFVLISLLVAWQSFLIYIYVKHGFFSAIRDAWFLQLIAILPVAYVMTCRTNYLFVPGGIVKRFAYFWSNTPKLSLLRRHECLTLIVPHNRAELKILIIHMPTRTRLLFTMNHKACDLFLSSWLSPLQTPTLEEMSDFT